jgi:chemotaxis protein CheX
MCGSTILLERYGAAQFLSQANIDRADATVIEVFRMMFGFDIQIAETVTPDPQPRDRDERTAVVGFSGAMRGSCHVRMSPPAVRSIASAMLGMPIEDDDDAIDDAVGELCNMLAGSWKRGIPELWSKCALSPPTVISGRDYKVHVHKPSMKLSRTYRFGEHEFSLTLCCEDCAQANG